MRLTRYSDFAMRVLLYLAARTDRRCSIAEIAKAYGISENHLMKVVQELAKAGYVDSARGRTGGIRLGRPASEIRVGEVIRVTEGDFDLVDCPSCLISPACGLRGVLGEAVAAFLAVLDSYSLEDLMRRKADMLALFALDRDAGRAVRLDEPRLV